MLLACGQLYIPCGATAGSFFDLDVCDMNDKGMSRNGTTAWGKPVFLNVIRFIKGSEIMPFFAANWTTGEIAAVQEAFAKEDLVGNFVLISPEQAPG